MIFYYDFRKADLPVKVISGFSKGFSYSPEKHFSTTTKTDHAWNAVRVDGVWHFIECTWGAGYLDENNKFQREVNEFYFLTDPKHFINDHFPWQSQDEGGDSYTWQLLPKPISLDTFNKTLKLEHIAIMWNVIPLTHKEGTVEAHEEVDIVIGDKKGHLSDTKLKFTNMETGMSCNDFTFLRQERSGEFSISVRPPSNERYKLQIFGKSKKSEKLYSLLMTYVIRFSNVRKNYSSYPPNRGYMWGMHSEAFDNGFIRTEKNTNPIKIKSKDGYIDKTFTTVRNIATLAKLIPATAKLSSNYDNNCFVTSTNTSLNIKACFPENDLYKLELMCQRVGGDNSYYSMACFLIECTKPASPCLGYPKSYSAVATFCCKLIEPLSGKLPANTKVTCRFQSPLVVKAFVSDMEMDQDRDEWSCILTTPSAGSEFYISGNIDNTLTFCRLYEYDII